MLDNKKPLDKVGITRNDEPTRFLTKEEMEQLEKAVFEPVSTKKEQASKNSRIRIEDISAVKTQTSSMVMKTKSYKSRVSQIIKKLAMVITIIAVAILGFYLAFTLSFSSVEDYVVEKSMQQEQMTTSEKQAQMEQEDLSIIGVKQQAEEKLVDVQNRLNEVKQLVDDVKTNLSTLEEVKLQVVEMKNLAQDLVVEHEDTFTDFKLEVENLIKNF